MTKARLLLPREEMFLALTVRSAFLMAAAGGLALELMPLAAQAESENPFFPSRKFASAAGEAWHVCAVRDPGIARRER